MHSADWRVVLLRVRLWWYRVQGLGPRVQKAKRKKLPDCLLDPGRWALNPLFLLRVEFDDQLLVDAQVDVFALRQGHNLAGESVALDTEPPNVLRTCGEHAGYFEWGHALAALQSGAL